MRCKYLFVSAAWLMMAGLVTAAVFDQTSRLQNAATVVSALRTQPDNGIPEKLWEKAACVVVIPNLKKAAFGIGGEYGKGVMSCRKADGWGAPAFMELEKGSWGFQIGGTEIDLVLLVMNREGAQKLLNNKVSLGADASVAAGPAGRAAAASTDGQLSAEILSYSRAKGIFAGVDISGGVLRADKDANTDVYGANTDAKDIAFGNAKPPVQAQAFLRELGRQSVGTSGK